MQDKSTLYTFLTVGVLSLISLVVSLILSVETVNVVGGGTTSCGVNAWLDCGTVMKTSQSKIFGFPNPFLGIAGFAVLSTIAVAVLMGSKLSKIFMAGVQLFVIGSFVFAEWMFEQSVFVIKVLCPFCLIVSFSMTIIFFAITRYNVLNKNLFLPDRISNKLIDWLKEDYDKILAVIWIGLMIGIIILRFPVA